MDNFLLEGLALIACLFLIGLILVLNLERRNAKKDWWKDEADE